MQMEAIHGRITEFLRTQGMTDSSVHDGDQKRLTPSSSSPDTNAAARQTFNNTVILANGIVFAGISRAVVFTPRHAAAAYQKTMDGPPKHVYRALK